MPWCPPLIPTRDWSYLVFQLCIFFSFSWHGFQDYFLLNHSVTHDRKVRTVSCLSHHCGTLPDIQLIEACAISSPVLKGRFSHTSTTVFSLCLSANGRHKSKTDLSSDCPVSPSSFSFPNLERFFWSGAMRGSIALLANLFFFVLCLDKGFWF